MIPFCLSLGLSRNSKECLEDTTEKLISSAVKRNAFLHTTIFQGVSNSLDEVIDWAKSSDSIVNQSKSINSLYYWDRFGKKIGDLIKINYDDKYSAVCLMYLHSHFITYLSYEISKELTALKIIKGFDSLNSLDLIETSSKANLTYALDFQYMAISGLVKAHTTLGFIDNASNSFLEVNSQFKANKRLEITHDGIYITKLDKFCMTPILDRYLVADLLIN